MHFDEGPTNSKARELLAALRMSWYGISSVPSACSSGIWYTPPSGLWMQVPLVRYSFRAPAQPRTDRPRWSDPTPGAPLVHYMEIIRVEE